MLNVVLILLLVALACPLAASVIPLALPAAGQRLAPVPLELTVPDLKGSYTIPYIQSDTDLRVRVVFPPGGPTRARLILIMGDQPIAERDATPADPDITIEGLHPAEYRLRLGGLGEGDQIVCSATWRQFAVGTIIGAIGDSITEGYHGHGFWRDDLNLRADMFPPEAVSKDGRNFPQYSPTTAWHRPDINCFQSWMTDLNNLLTQKWDQPFFIANEGYGGISTGATLNTMRNDKGWQARMKLLRPQVWLIHLGVNDERAKVPAADVGRNLEAIVSLLIQDYGAEPHRIVVARPCYDYAEGAEAILKGYIAEIDALVARRGLRPGPDFFAAYAVERAKWYGDDPVHPNIAGMEYMAQLWAEAIGTAALR